MRSHSPSYEVISRTNKRENNEDSFQVFTIAPGYDPRPISILAVADGMGGHAHGEEASEQTLRKFSLSLFESLTIQSSINSLPQEVREITLEKLSQCLREGLKAANEHIGRIVKSNNWGTAGSTVVVTAILENTALVINLGDSPLFHYQASSKRLTQITEDHTVAGVLQRAGMITPEMARVHEGRSRLQFYVGCPELPPELPVYQVNLARDDLLLLCSDGVNGSLLLKDIANILATKKSLKEKAEALVKKALDNKETDNQTLILWSHQNYSGPKTSPPIAKTRSGTKNNANNSQETKVEWEKTPQSEGKGGNFLKLFLLPLIFIGTLAFGAYAFSFLMPDRQKQTQGDPATTETEIEEEQKTATNEGETNSKESSEQQKNSQEDRTIKNRPAPDYYSCDEEPQNPDRFSKETSYRMYVKYDKVMAFSNIEEVSEFTEIDGMLLDICPHQEIDGSLRERYKKIGQEKMFEIWSETEERLKSIEQKMKNVERNQRGIEFDIEIIPPET